MHFTNNKPSRSILIDTNLRPVEAIAAHWRKPKALGVAPLFLFVLLTASPLSALHAQSRRSGKLPRPRQLDRGITWKRDSATGEVHPVTPEVEPGGRNSAGESAADAISVVTAMVPVTCSVSTSDGTAVPGLQRDDFRIRQDGVEQKIAYFDSSAHPASVALVIDASPSVLRDANEMKRAADALIDALAPLDEAAVLDFSAHIYLQSPFSDVRERIRRAVAQVDPRRLLDDTGGSNIYEAVYLAARQFSGRTGRKAIVLLTDGQDSGLGLTLESAISQARGPVAQKLTFEDVLRFLAAEDIQVFAVSTESRPKIMTREWISEHSASTLITEKARDWAIPPYTLFLAELVRRAGGDLYFLHESDTMADAFRLAARAIRAEYTLGFYPANISETPGHSGWHQLQVDVAGQPGALVFHRGAYYVPNGG